MTPQRFLALLQQYKTGQLSETDKNDWLQALEQPEYAALFEQEMRQTFNSFDTAPSWDADVKKQVLQNIRTEAGISKRRYWQPVGWAAAILVLIFAGYFMFDKGPAPAPVVKTVVVQPITAPQTNRAVITLANGQQVFLDSLQNGAIASQGAIQVTKLSGGQIAYTGSTTEVSYNTLMNPKGSRVINMTFSDGSRVWLNAGSSLRYPVAFVGNERKVEISGEAYFEVAHDAGKPFKVVKNDMEVKVLGTHFNVNAYDDEETAKVTLLEGKVQVAQVVLKPGQQAVIGNAVTINNEVDLDEVMAWKNDRFLFGDKADIGAIMRQISRWYDVEVEFKGAIDQHLGGSISRQTNVDEVLKMLEKTGVVHFELSGRKVTVLP